MGSESLYRMVVSILVLMDLAHEYGYQYRSLKRISVSILVLMDLAHECIRRIDQAKLEIVSILVLMDLAHEYFFKYVIFNTLLLFQSLF